MNYRENDGRIKTAGVIMHYVNQFKGLFIALFTCIILTTFSGSVYPYIFGLLVDKVFSAMDMTMFIAIVLLYAAVFTVNQCLHLVLNMAWAKLMIKYIYKIREDMFSVLQHFPCKQLEDRKSGDIIQRINWDSEQFLVFIHKNIFYLAASALEFLISLGFIFFLDWYSGILVSVVTPVVVFSSRHFSKKAGKYYKEKAKLNGNRNAWLFEVIQHIHEIKLLGARSSMTKIYCEQNDKLFENQIATANEEVKIDRINKCISLLAQLAVFGIATVQVIAGNITIGCVIAILGYFDICTSSFNKVNTKLVALRDNKAGIDRCIEVLEKQSEDYNENGEKHEIKNADIRFEKVFFSYDGQINVLNNINLTINKNETIGVVGTSGGGKSTLAMMINKLYLPTKGKIFIDNMDVNDYELHHLRDQIGVVYQENCFFKGSVRFNLIFSEDKSRDNDLLSIIEKVNLKGFIDGLPNGLDTVIMNGERNLSGGQKQRLAIARVYAKNPKIIIFDEATSALDSESENVVQKSWTDLFPECTKIIISHRLSTIVNADRIVVIHNNRIDSIGTHSELIKNCEQYVELFRQQTDTNPF